MRKNGRYLGLDIGAAGVKAVVLKRTGKEVSLEATDELHTLEEGILNEQELHSSIVQWLHGKKWDKLPTVIGLPQYLAQTMLKEFPVIKNAAKLDVLVNSEISQVAGLSEETLVHDYCQLHEGGGRKNGFLIGLCREQTIRERLTGYEVAGIRTDAIALGGMAVANAYLTLKYNASENGDASKPVLLLDLGRENAVAVIMAGKVPLFVSSLMVSGERFEQAVKSANQPVEGKKKVSLSAKSVEEINLLDEIGTSPVMLAANLLESEIQGVVENWRAQEDYEVGKTPIAKVMVCGGIAKMKGLCEWLTERLETPVEVFGPEVDGMVRPELTMAYGLAAQCAEDEKAALSLSMLPADIRWRKLREANYPFLVAALALWVVVMAVLGILWYVRTTSLIGAYMEQQEKLEKCGNLIGRIESAQNALYDREAKVVPLVEAGCQPVRLKNALEEIGTACAADDWIVYLADETSYHQAKEDERRDERRSSSSLDMFGGAKGTDYGDASGVPEFPIRMLPRDISVTTRFITASYAPLKPSQRFAPATEFAKKLNEGGLFKGVDTLQGQESRVDIFAPWAQWLKGVRGQFVCFSFALPFADADVRKELLPIPVVKGKGKSKK